MTRRVPSQAVFERGGERFCYVLRAAALSARR